MSRTQISISTLLSCLDNFDCYISYDVGRDGKMCGYCQYYWGYIRANFFFSCANFLAAYPQTNYKHCAVLDCAKSN